MWLRNDQWANQNYVGVDDYILGVRARFFDLSDGHTLKAYKQGVSALKQTRRYAPLTAGRPVFADCDRRT